MRKFGMLLILMSLTAVSHGKTGHIQFSPADLANPLMGTLSTYEFSAGNTYPAIALPWGMNFWTPQTGPMGNGWTYYYAGKKIRGLKQTHQPSPWINDYGQFSVMPVVGLDKIDEEARASWFSHLSEKVTPYYYSVYLADHDVFAEMAPTERAVVMQFTFSESDESAIIIDAFDRGSHARVIPEKNMVVGYTTRNSGGVPDNFRNWFVIVSDTPFNAFDILDNNVPAAGKDAITSKHAGARLRFATSKGQKISLRIASSFISAEQAMENLKELGGHDIAEIASAGKNRWNDVLGHIEAEFENVDQARTFYTCLYRSVLFPRKFYEITGDGDIVHYSPYNGEVREGYMYTDTGFWDTFRCLFPLLNLIYPSVNAEIQQGLVNTYLESGFLPEWASPGHRDCMIGNNSASVVADAIMKGIGNTDIHLLFEAMWHGAHYRHPVIGSTGRMGLEYYNTLGYIPYDVGIRENTARTLEYAYNDWCILQVAKKMGRPQEEIDILEKRAQNYRNVFDPESGLMRGRNKDGSFQSPFSPFKWGDAFTEGNSWHYTWSVFHDVQGLVGLMGGEKRFTAMLDSVFVVPPVYDDSYYGSRIHEITEMQVAHMGNYAHGNQPAQHMIYLYNYAGQPWKAQYWVRETMDRLYRAVPDGYCGDEDNGQTSAWYVFSALGFYPVCPGTDQYVIGSPLIRKAVLNLENGNKVEISAPSNGSRNRYIAEMRLNGKKYGMNYVSYGDLKKGAKIDFLMSAEPNMQRGTSPETYPYSMNGKR